VKRLSNVALAVSGDVLPAITWWCGRTVLDIADEAAAVTSGRSAPGSVARGGPASRPSSMRGGRSTIGDAARRFAGTQPEVSS